MSTAYNEHTGQRLVSKASTASYVRNFDNIFAPKRVEIRLPEEFEGTFTTKDLEQILDAFQWQVANTTIAETKGRLLGAYHMMGEDLQVTTVLEVRSTVKDKLEALANTLDLPTESIQTYLAIYKIVFDAL